MHKYFVGNIKVQYVPFQEMAIPVTCLFDHYSYVVSNIDAIFWLLDAEK